MNLAHLDGTSREIIWGLLGTGKLTTDEAAEVAALGTLPRIIRVLVGSGRMSKRQAKSFVNDESAE